MQNMKIRKIIKDSAVRHWQIADNIGISEMSLVRLLRYPLTNEKEQEIMAAIEALKTANERKENRNVQDKV